MMERLSRVFDDVLQQDFLPLVKNELQSLRTDITETKDAYIVQADLPGFSKEDIHIDIEKNRLTIRAKRDVQTEVRDDKDRIIRQERHAGEFVRSFEVENINQDRVEANLENGVLQIKLPKVEPGDDGRAKRIEIN